MTMFETLNAPLVQAFYRCRVQEDLKQKISFPAKGTVKKVNKGMVDKKTQGSSFNSIVF